MRCEVGHDNRFARVRLFEFMLQKLARLAVQAGGFLRVYESLSGGEDRRVVADLLLRRLHVPSLGGTAIKLEIRPERRPKKSHAAQFDDVVLQEMNPQLRRRPAHFGEQAAQILSVILVIACDIDDVWSDGALSERFSRPVNPLRSTGDIAGKHYDVDIEFWWTPRQRALRSKNHFQMKVGIDRESHSDWLGSRSWPSLLS